MPYFETGTTLDHCTSSNAELYSFSRVDNNDNSVVTAFSTSYDYFYRPIITLADNGCTIESFIGKIVSADSEQTDIDFSDDKYVLNNTNGDITVNLSYEQMADSSYSVSGDIETRELLISSYSGNDSDMVIPSQISGNDIVGFSDEFFLPDDVRNIIKSITVPGTIKEIPADIFNGMQSLESVTLGEGVECIGSYAFGGCQNLLSITLPDSLSTIEASAFSICTKLSNIKFGNGLENIDALSQS